jgi:hypothetical protein
MVALDVSYKPSIKVGSVAYLGQAPGSKQATKQAKVSFIKPG